MLSLVKMTKTRGIYRKPERFFVASTTYGTYSYKVIIFVLWPF